MMFGPFLLQSDLFCLIQTLFHQPITLQLKCTMKIEANTREELEKLSIRVLMKKNEISIN